MSEQSRRPEDTPTGGQFATSAHPESATTLTTTRVVDLDESVMDQIALMLGTAEEWDGAADYLEDIANLVAASGRPHPGDGVPREYRAAMAELKAARDGEANPTTRQLDRLALHLGTSAQWDGADCLEVVANMVGASGRPHPGGGDPGAYLVEIAQLRSDRAPDAQAAAAILTDALSTLVTDVADATSWTASPVQDGAGAWSYGTTIVWASNDDEPEEYDLAGTPGEILLLDLAARQPTDAHLPAITVNLPVSR